ncbi:MAG TPA: hypothetical protein DCX79_01830, partial [Planctomycetaceae bacterium]|nr:hypothetical protein [Planctomycetaceae bacterium]
MARLAAEQECRSDSLNGVAPAFVCARYEHQQAEAVCPLRVWMIVSPPRPVPIASARARTRNRKEWFRPYEQGFSRLNPTVQCVSGTGTQ